MGRDQYAIVLDEEKKLVLVVVRGSVTKKVGEEIITKARTVAKINYYNIFFDVKRVELDVNISD